MSESEPIVFRRLPQLAVREADRPRADTTTASDLVVFNRQELGEIFNVYGRRVATGDWRDYAIDWGREAAVFSIFRRASEVPIYRVVKSPKLARRQGTYSVVSATGQILKRGPDLRRVLAAIDLKVAVVR